MQSCQRTFFNVTRWPFLITFRKAQSILFIFFILSLSSCGGSAVSIPKAETYSKPASVNVELAPGDEIEIKFAFSPEFNESQTIRPDGKVELLLVGEIDAAGKSPSRLRDELIGLYAKHLAHPQLAVMMRSKRQVYVGGSVKIPGVLEMPGRLTAMEAIMASGGFDLISAEVRNVIIIRFRAGEYQAYSLDFEKNLSGTNSEPFYLEPRDIVYVPRTRIAKVSQWMKNHFWEIIPVRFGTGYYFQAD